MLIICWSHVIQKLQGLIVPLFQNILVFFLIQRFSRGDTGLSGLFSLEVLERREELEFDEYLVYPLHFLMQQLEEIDFIDYETRERRGMAQYDLLDEGREVEHALRVVLSGRVALEVEGLENEVLDDARVCVQDGEEVVQVVVVAQLDVLLLLLGVDTFLLRTLVDLESSQNDHCLESPHLEVAVHTVHIYHVVVLTCAL